MLRHPSELPWTPAETKQLITHAEVIASLRDKVEQGTADNDEKKRFSKAVFALKKSVEDKERPASDVILAADAEGHEARFDLREIRRISDKFYRDHQLEDLATALPPDIRLTSEQVDRLKEAAKEGFDRAFVFAAPEKLTSHLAALIEQCATRPVAGLSSDDQYTEPYVDNSAKAPVIRNRPEQKAYLLLYSSKPVAPETKNLTFPQVEELFKKKQWNGLTLEEYLVLQRFEAEARTNHSFDAYPSNAANSNLIWLMDSTSDASASRVLLAGWGPGGHQVLVDSGSSDFQYPDLGARPSVVLTLETLP